MKNFLKDNWFKLSILLFVILISGVWFYWFQLRPAKIKHDCSWVSAHSDAVPAITQAQYTECVNNYKGKKGEVVTGGFLDGVIIGGASSYCNQPRVAQPAKNWWEPASVRQYDFCMHEKGL